MGILLDTDIAIDYLRGVQAAVDLVQNNQQQIVLSAVTVAELYAGVRDGAEKGKLTRFINLFPVIPVDHAIAEAAGLYRRDFGPSHNTGLADGMIAATAEIHGLDFLTLSTRHYPMFSELRPPYVRH